MPHVFSHTTDWLLAPLDKLQSCPEYIGEQTQVRLGSMFLHCTKLSKDAKVKKCECKARKAKLRTVLKRTGPEVMKEPSRWR